MLNNLIRQTPSKQFKPKILSGIPIEQLDDLPPLNFAIFNKYIGTFKHLSISLSRGCPFNCHFCMEKDLSNCDKKIKRWRVYSPRRAIKEVEVLTKYGDSHNIHEFGFYDPIFGLNRTWLEKFLDLYNSNETSYAWIETRLDILNETLIKRIYKKNFLIMYGLESYSKKILSIMNKTNNPSQYLDKFEKVYGVHKNMDKLYALNILCNHPGETKKTYLDTFNRLEKIKEQDFNDSVFLNIRFYHHFPGTKLFNNLNYFKENFGTNLYITEWWKNEDLLKYGPYCIRPSKELPLKESMDLYTNHYKNLVKMNLTNMKTNRPNNLIQRAIIIKSEIKKLEQRRVELFNFLDKKGIEIVDYCLNQ